MYDDYLKLDPYTFDQSESGWRKLDKEGEYLDTARLIDTYIQEHEQDIKNQTQVSLQTFYFHAGQEYAMAGEAYYHEAVMRFQQAFKQKTAWDLYVHGSIAFLRKDIIELKSYADDLQSLASKDSLQQSNAQLLHKFYSALQNNETSYKLIYGE